MYYQYFGLTEAPFSIAVNPRYLFMSARHRDALAHLLYGVEIGGGFIVLTGEVGTGKTTINRCLLEQLPHDTDIAMILNPALNAIELLASACDELGIEYDEDKHTLKTLTDSLHSFLLDNHKRGRKTVLLIDEAQHLDFEVLEQIRLLTNLETNSEKLLQIILIGQPELSQILARQELRQLNQRITARYNLEPLNLDETGAYIHHRLQVAGMSPERVIFPASVVRGIYKVTRGIPRVINVLCDRIMLGAYGRNKARADIAMLRTAQREVLGEQGSHGVPWRWPAAVAATLVILLMAWWLVGTGRGLLTSPVEKVASVPTPATQPDVPSSDAVLGDDRPEPVIQSLPATERVSVVPPARDVSSVLEPTQMAPIEQSAPAEEKILAPRDILSAALLPVGDAMARQWPLFSGGAVPPNACPKLALQGVACIEGSVQTWDELAGFNRPLSLNMVTPQRFSAQVLLLGMEGPEAWVWTPEGIARLNLSELAPLWTGSYAFLWHPPAGFAQPLSLGQSDPAVIVIAQMFARLDGQPRPLAEQFFNATLQQRVRLFQREHGLVDDGVVGVQTLLKLNEQLGVDVTAVEARRQLQSVSVELQQ